MCAERAPRNALICGCRVGLAVFSSSVASLYFPFRVTRSYGVRTADSPASLQGELHSKLSMVLGRGLEYTLEVPTGYQVPAGLALHVQAETLATDSPVMHLRGLGCTLQGVSRVGSLDELRRATGSAQFASGRDVWVKLRTSTGGGSSMATVARTSHAFSCP